MTKIVAVAACPAGIAHTYMAAESLERGAKKKGYEIKVETDGASGVENQLTSQEIADADYVILAVDAKVETARFAGKKVLQVSTTDAIRNLKQVFAQMSAMDEDK